MISPSLANLKTAPSPNCAPVQRFLVENSASITPVFHKYPFNQLPQGPITVENTNKLEVKIPDIDIADQKIGDHWIYYYMKLVTADESVTVADQFGNEYHDHAFVQKYDADNATYYGYLKHGYKNADDLVFFVIYNAKSERRRTELLRSDRLYSPESDLHKTVTEESNNGYHIVLHEYRTYTYRYARKHIIDCIFENGIIAVRDATIKHAQYSNVHYRVMESALQFAYPNRKTLPRTTHAKFITPNVFKVEADIDRDYDLKLHQYDVLGNFVREITGDSILSIDGPYVHIRQSVNSDTPVLVSYFAKQVYFMVPVPTLNIGEHTLMLYLRPRNWSTFSKNTLGNYIKVPNKLHYVIYNDTGGIEFASEHLINKGDDTGDGEANVLLDTDLPPGVIDENSFGKEYTGENALVLAFVTNSTGVIFADSEAVPQEQEINFTSLKDTSLIQYLAAASQALNGGGRYVVFHRPYTNPDSEIEFEALGTKALLYEV